MSSSFSELQNIFEYELKRKISERAKTRSQEIKTLLDCFKYFDTNYEGEIDKTYWIKGIQRTGLTGFSDEDLDSLYYNYVQSFSGKIDYKDFCNYLYGRERDDPLSKSLKNKNINLGENTDISIKNNIFSNSQKIDLNQNNNYYIRRNRRYDNINNNIDNNENSKSNNNLEIENNDSESLINRIKEMIHVNNGVTFYSFINFLKSNEDPTSHKVSLEELSVAMQELKINISYSDIHEFFNNLDSENDGRILTNDIINIIKGSLDDKRKSYITKIFSNIDSEKKGEVSINNLKNIYDAKNHPDVLNGKKSEEEIYNQFCYTIDVYIRINNIINNNINNQQFIDYYSGISPSIKNDIDFKKILIKVWNTEKNKYKFIRKKGYSVSNEDYDNNLGDNDIGINSIFLGVSKTLRPTYDYNYDYLEESSKSSPKNINNKKTLNKNINNNESNINNNRNKNLLSYSYKINNQNNNSNNYINKSLSSVGESIINNYNKNNYQKKSNSNTFSFNSSIKLRKGQNKYINYESSGDTKNKGIRVFKSKRYNPITDEFIEEENSNSNIVQEIQNNLHSSNDNIYIKNNYNQNNSQNNLNFGEDDSYSNNKDDKINEDDIIQSQNEENQKSEEKNLNIYNNYNLKENSSLIKFRNILISLGTKSIFRFQRILSIYDRDHSGLISFDNFYTIFQAYYNNIPLSDIKSIFSLFDTNNKNENYQDASMFKINYDDLFKSLIGNISLRRITIIKKVFDSFNKDFEDKIMISDLKTKFNLNRHPDVLSKKKTANEVYSDFLDFLEIFREYNDNLKGGFSFDMNFEDFCNFYKEIGMSIENDDNFENLLYNCWDIEKENNENVNDNNETKNKSQQLNNININKNGLNMSNNYHRINQSNNGNSSNNRYNNNNNNEYSNNIRMKVGSQIINNRIF